MSQASKHPNYKCPQPLNIPTTNVPSYNTSHLNRRQIPRVMRLYLSVTVIQYNRCEFFHLLISYEAVGEPWALKLDKCNQTKYIYCTYTNIFVSLRLLTLHPFYFESLSSLFVLKLLPCQAAAAQLFVKYVMRETGLEPENWQHRDPAQPIHSSQMPWVRC